MKKAMMALLMLALVGCGSSGGGPGSGATGGAAASGGHPGGGGQGGAGAGACAMFTGGGTTSSGTVSWNDNGKAECAFLAIVERTPATAADTIEIDAVTETSAAVDLALSSYAGLLGGTYACQPGNGTTAPYVALVVENPNLSGGSTTSDCSITLSFTTDSAGTEHAQGTFSGTVTGDGGTDVITDGTFDVTVTINGG